MTRFWARHPGRITLHAGRPLGRSDLPLPLRAAVLAAGGSAGPRWRTLQLLAPALRVDELLDDPAPAGRRRHRLDGRLHDDRRRRTGRLVLSRLPALAAVPGQRAVRGPDRQPITGHGGAIRASRELLAAFGLDPVEQRAAEVVWSPTGDDAPPGRRSMAVNHGGFDNDADTMNSVAARILGRAPEPGFPPWRVGQPVPAATRVTP